MPGLFCVASRPVLPLLCICMLAACSHGIFAACTIGRAYNRDLIVSAGGPAEYDLGERFDLKAKYADKGWVDEDADFGKQVARFFGGLGGKKKPVDPGNGPAAKGKSGTKR